MFDLLKIRKLVDEATNLSVRATSGIASSALSNSLNASNGLLGNGGAALGMGTGGGGTNAKLSRERKHRMREQATQKLAKAYYLDEIACSVATMQAASTLEDVAHLVLQRSASHVEGKYVHFFHEKIPSRQLADCTSLQPLDEIVAERPNLGEPLRTRALTKIFKQDFAGAAQDLTAALQVCRYCQSQHKAGRQELQLASTAGAQQHSRWKEDIKLDEEDHPSSLEPQLLFHRAGVYLTIACEHISNALPRKGSHRPPKSSNGISGLGNYTNESHSPILEPEKTSADLKAETFRLAARKLVKTNAKRALRDYISFLSHFDYTPGLPAEATEEFVRKVNQAANGFKIPRPTHDRVFDMNSNASLSNGQLSNAPVPHHAANNRTRYTSSLPRNFPALPPPMVYEISALFSSTPPPDLPPYPALSTSVATTKCQPPSFPADTSSPGTHEALTYHPLLTDALHSLLLCHTLLQTSPRELTRHAHMVARLIRLCDGHPVFQGARSPSRGDWIEVLRKHEDVAVAGSWEDLCRPAGAGCGERKVGRREDGKEETEKERRERWRQQAVMEALEDERVCDEESFRRAVAARQRRCEEEDSRRGGMDGVNGNGGVNGHARKWQDDEREYTVGTERAQRIVRWVREAPVGESMGAKKRRKGVKKPKAREEAGLNDSMSDVKVAEDGVAETAEEVN